MPNFSPQLIAEITQYFAEKYEVVLTPGQAEEYLNSWADLWSAVARGQAELFRLCPLAGKPDSRTPPVILDSLHT